MFSLIFEGALLVMLVGYGLKLYLDKTNHEARIDNQEFGIASALLLLLVIPLTAYFGTKISINNQLTFNENWGGFEVRTHWVKTECHRDGSMRYYYKGDPYQVWVDDSYTDSKGKRHKQGHYETRYHDIPYTTEEWTFTIDTTVGTYTIADRNLPANPNNYRYRAWVSVPDNLPSGIPAFWTAADNRLRQGTPGPVTASRQYKNYILASQNTILHRYSSDIEGYKKAGELPDLNQQAIHDFYYSDRVFFVGTIPPGNWQLALNKFDAALGSSLQGDLYLVIVDANKIPDPDNYSLALTAYWESKAFDRDALSKNGIVVVLGTKDGRTVSWARATTGMPEGNEEMLLDVQNNLKGASLDPQTILGQPQARLVGDNLQLLHTSGALENILWGTHKFQRVHMDAHGQGAVGYKYLMRELQPTTGQRIGILLVMTLFGIIAWVVCIFHGAPAYRYHRSAWSRY